MEQSYLGVAAHQGLRPLHKVQTGLELISRRPFDFDSDCSGKSGEARLEVDDNYLDEKLFAHLVADDYL
jgi:hypothetical protein